MPGGEAQARAVPPAGGAQADLCVGCTRGGAEVTSAIKGVGGLWESLGRWQRTEYFCKEKGTPDRQSWKRAGNVV